ncbi:MAG: ribokinase [Pseudomonadota bacterium]
MIFNLGSINADYFYDLPHLPGPGETLAATRMASGLGGKGANQSVAAALAGSDVRHIGAVGPDGAWAVEKLMSFGVDTRHVQESAQPTAHAIVMVDNGGENQIVIFPGANLDQNVSEIEHALASGGSGDWLLLQNETSCQVDTAQPARAKGMNVAYSAAPFEVDAVRAMLPHTTLLIMNEVEAQQFKTETGKKVQDLTVPHLLITKGKDGAVWHDLPSSETVSVPAFSVDTIDTTGAGDTFSGYAVAGLDQGLTVSDSLRRASAAAALSTIKKGTADAIPDLESVEAFLAAQDTNGALDPQS